MSSNILADVLCIIERYGMLNPKDTVIVGLSGGADSVALISILNDLKNEYDLNLIAAHINHGLRGKEATRDEIFAQNLCESLGVDFRALHADVPRLAVSQGMSFETCGRNVRYNFFTSLAREAVEKAGVSPTSVKIATAHNAGDVAETFLFNLARGSGLRGLTSIPPVRKSGDSRFYIIRPLISSTRLEIEEYLTEKGISHIDDSTNADVNYARNRIRLNVIPELKKINDACVTNILRCSESLRDDDEYLQKLAADLLSKASIDDMGKYTAYTLAAAPKPLFSRAVAKLLRDASGIHPEKIHIEKAMGIITHSGKAQLTGGIFLNVEDGVVEFSKNTDMTEKLKSEYAYVEEPVNLKKSMHYSLPWADIKFTVVPYSEFIINLHNLVLENAIDYGKIECNFIMRNRRAGDKVKLSGRNVTKTLKNLFNEVKLPTEKRSSVSILECDDEIVWMDGFGTSSPYVVTESTESVLIVEVIRR